MILRSKNLLINRDDAGDWYFLALYSFTLLETKIKPSLKYFIETKTTDADIMIGQEGAREHHEMGERTASCKLCQLHYPMSQLPHKMTMLMLIKTEKQLRVLFS